MCFRWLFYKSIPQKQIILEVEPFNTNLEDIIEEDEVQREFDKAFN